MITAEQENRIVRNVRDTERASSMPAHSLGFIFKVDEDRIIEELDLVETDFVKELYLEMDKQGMTGPEVYTRANIEKHAFNNILSGTTEKPKLRTVYAILLALKPSEKRFIELLNYAGYSFSNGKLDRVVRNVIKYDGYDIDDANRILEKVGLKPLP